MLLPSEVCLGAHRLYTLRSQVDFRDLGYYAPSQEPNAGRFDPAPGPGSAREEDGTISRNKKEGDFPQPLLFLECACRLIIELAGGSG